MTTDNAVKLEYFRIHKRSRFERSKRFDFMRNCRFIYIQLEHENLLARVGKGRVKLHCQCQELKNLLKCESIFADVENSLALVHSYLLEYDCKENLFK